MKPLRSSRRLARAGGLATALVIIGGIDACLPRSPGASAAPFFFVQMADPQFGMFTANADFARETVNYERAVAAVNRIRPAFVVVAGDLTHRQGDREQIAEYRRISARIDPAIPLYSVPGNHDLGLPLSPTSVATYRETYGPDRYTFNRGGMLGIVINSTLIKEPGVIPGETASQETWLRETLAAARAGGYRRIMVFQHHPWFLTQPDEPDQYFNLPRSARSTFFALAAEAGVTHVFAGHYHRNAFGRHGAIEMVTTGPVGKPLGADSSGLRIVVVEGPTVTHRYYPLDSIPDRVLPHRAP